MSVSNCALHFYRVLLWLTKERRSGGFGDVASPGKTVGGQ